jgi:hypothetical protein
MDDHTGSHLRSINSRRVAAARVVLGIALGLLWLKPWSDRLASPNIIGDDVPRIIDLQTLTLWERLTRPFNEHLAPLFELVTALTWDLAGRRLADAPIAFTLASYVPFLLSLGMLWLLLHREWGSPTAANVAVSLFAATPIYAECVFWFSASTFCWALLFTLIALWFAGLARDRGSARYWLGTSAACLIAPMGSSIGLLAGPLAVIRAWPARRPSRPFRPEALALTPALGTLLFVAGASLFRYADAMSHSVRTWGDASNGLWCVGQAPLYLILTGYGRVRDAHHIVPPALSVVFFAAGLVAVGLRAWRGDAAERRWLMIGTLMILAGYTLIYSFRTFMVGPDELVRVQRYHLFPCLGMVLLLTTCLAGPLRRLDSHLLKSLAVPIALTAALVAINSPLMTDRLNFYRLQPDQRPVLATLDRLSEIAQARGFGREQVLRALDPVEPRWTWQGWNILRVLPRVIVSDPRSPDDPLIRRTLLRDLTARERSLLFAATNVTAYLEPGTSWAGRAESRPGQLVGLLRVHPLDSSQHYRSDGWPSFIEFAFPPGDPLPKALSLTGVPPGPTLELWWAGESSGWSAGRSVLIRVEQPGAGRADWVLPLDRLPHLDVREIRRLRIIVREPGPIAIGPPALLL